KQPFFRASFLRNQAGHLASGAADKSYATSSSWSPRLADPPGTGGGLHGWACRASRRVAFGNPLVFRSARQQKKRAARQWRRMFQWIMKEVANASPTGLALGLSYWALKWSACLCGSFVLLLVCFLSLARRKQLESLKQLEHLAGKREVLPFLNLYILFKACSQPDNPAGFGPLVFNAFFGFYACFQKYGMHKEYVGITPTITIYRADLVEEVLRSNKVITKGLMYKFLHSWLGTGLLTRLSELFMERMATPHANYERLYRMTAKGKEFTHWLNKQHAFTSEVIAERKKDMKATINSGFLLGDEDDNGSKYMKRKRPFLDTLLLEHFKDSKNITEEDMREEGHDTTAMGISWALFLIGLSPVEQQKIHDELDSIFGDDTERHVSHEDMKEMRYLECALKGHDTTAMGISWALFLIGHSPAAQQTIHDELDSIFGDDTERHVNHEDMREMRYLECALKVTYCSGTSGVVGGVMAVTTAAALAAKRKRLVDLVRLGVAAPGAPAAPARRDSADVQPVQRRVDGASSRPGRRIRYFNFKVNNYSIGGHDTTAVGVSWALFLIGLSPVEQQKIHDELDSIFGDDTERHVTTEDMKEMRYLECLIKESQRLYPSVPFYSRLCEEPFELVVQVSNYFLHRDPKVFSKPEEFRPDRFLPENSKGRHPFAYVTFSAGPRNCIGQRFAMSEEKIVLSNILRRYKLESLDHRDQVGLIAEMVLRPKGGLRIKFILRTSSKGA
ncbi:hypothetical protein HPB47_025772, partial [Ixodes persulcatus]